MRNLLPILLLRNNFSNITEFITENATKKTTIKSSPFRKAAIGHLSNMLLTANNDIHNLNIEFIQNFKSCESRRDN